MKVQDIYDITMALMDEMKNDGGVDYNSTKDYTARTPGILTILQAEIIIELKKAGADVETLDQLPKSPKGMDSDVDLDDDICMGVLPYGLAARLLGQEGSTLSDYFSSLYSNRLYDAVQTSDSKAKAKQIDREDVYDSTFTVVD